MKDRYTNLERIRALDPKHDYQQIYRTMLRFEFPWDMKLALNLAFNRAHSVPEIASVLASTGELTTRTQKRLDDTGLLMYEIVLNGFDHPRGRESTRRINQIHHRWPDILNEQYVWVLGCLVVIPIRWLDRYGWRQPCCHEREASYQFYRDLGQRMNVIDIPDSYTALESSFDAYDAEHLRPNADAAAIEQATRVLMHTRLPRLLAPLGNHLISAMYEDRHREAMLLDRPAWPVRAGLHLGLKARANLLRRLGKPRKTAMFEDGIKTKTYPDGYDISQLGPSPESPVGRPDT